MKLLKTYSYFFSSCVAFMMIFWISNNIYICLLCHLSYSPVRRTYIMLVYWKKFILIKNVYLLTEFKFWNFKSYYNIRISHFNVKLSYKIIYNKVVFPVRKIHSVIVNFPIMGLYTGFTIVPTIQIWWRNTTISQNTPIFVLGALPLQCCFIFQMIYTHAFYDICSKSYFINYIAWMPRNRIFCINTKCSL